MNQEYTRREGENDLDYAMRLVSIKKDLRPNDLDWCDIVDYLGLDYNPDSLRKSQDSPFGGISVYREMQKRIMDNKGIDISAELSELKKIRCSIADERAALNKLIREQSRVESIRTLARECVGKMEPLEPHRYLDVIHDRNKNGKKSLVVVLSDFHFGLEIDEFNNRYDKRIFQDRLEYLLAECIAILDEHPEIANVIVLGIGDFIAGLIHNVIRVESRENIVEQVIFVSEALIHFIYELAGHAKVDYYDCVGNHSRLFEDKNNCLAKESFDILIHYNLENRFLGCKEVCIHDYTISERVGEFKAFGLNYGFVHGDGFNIDTLAKDMSLLTKTFYEAIFIGHIHHVFVEEQDGTFVIANGSFAGNDEYSNKLRKSSYPSQNLILISENGVESIKTVKLDKV